jgi:RNA polymerase sigma-70 factor (ECF subfamily)
LETGAGFETIFKSYNPKILRYITRLIGDCETDDLTQEVFVKISTGLQNFNQKSRLSTWIYRIATNTAIDRLQSSSFKQAKNYIPEDELIAEDKEAGTDKKVLAMDQKLIEKEMNECIRNFIYHLPEKYRTVLVLSELEGLKNRELSEILEISLDTVKIRLHRARARLKKELECYCDFYRTEESQLACEPTKTTPKFK